MEYNNIIIKNIQRKGYHYSTIVGNSMYPLLRNRKDRIIVKKDIKPSVLDIVLFERNDGKVILHRIIWKSKHQFLIIGDNQSNIERVEFDRVKGVMESFYRGHCHISKNNPLYILYSLMVWILLPSRIILLKIINKLNNYIG